MGKEIVTHKITIPGELPDLNTIIEVAKQHYGNYSRMKRVNTETVTWVAKKLPVMTRIRLTCRWYCKDRKKDKDNISVGIKFILDGLVEAGIIANDGWKQVDSFGHEFYVDKQKPRVEVIIEEMEG